MTIVFDWSVLFIPSKKTRLGYPRRFSRSLVRWLIKHGWDVCVISPLWLEWFPTMELVRHFLRLKFPFVEIVHFDSRPEFSIIVSFDQFIQKKQFFFLKLFIKLRKLNRKKSRIPIWKRFIKNRRKKDGK